MDEHVTLIKEISELRRELKYCREVIHDLNLALAMEGQGQKKRKPGIKIMTPMMEQDVEEQKKIIEMQQLELRRLRDEIYDLETLNNVTRTTASSF